ncbi:MAG TPA: 16S rRNA (cytosine(1402)-N(4))-methyltransferase RsmH [Rhabdaerophilum sp.]|nr:16S rRNA (cytosine(1402)-N(4))-methyltransferase RsmH [Rhabdaerophilum sp.]
MTGHGASSGGADGGPARHVSLPQSAEAPHIPVLLDEVLAALKAGEPGVYLDGTFGAGGYTRALLDANPANRVLALDRDPTAIAGGQGLVAASGGRLILRETEFSNMETAAAGAGIGPFDGIVLDIGVSSMQLDQAIRGFSFRNDGPLDMRMSGQGETAADIVNHASETRIADILFHYGEERLSRVIARAIIADRKKQSFATTRQLADMIARVVRTRPGDIHPATRSFQALRIAVNEELGELATALHAAERLLKPGGRLVIVSFHSLEDRIVKQFFAARSGRGGGSRYAPVQASTVATFRIEGKWPVTAGEDELKRNPRARSAKLRCAIRTASPAQPEDDGIFALTRLPDEKGWSRHKGGRR